LEEVLLVAARDFIVVLVGSTADFLLLLFIAFGLVVGWICLQ
jgi:hypothetical protein